MEEINSDDEERIESHLFLKIKFKIGCPVLFFDAKGYYSDFRSAFHGSFVNYAIWWGSNDVAEIFTSYLKFLSAVSYNIFQHTSIYKETSAVNRNEDYAQCFWKYQVLKFKCMIVLTYINCHMIFLTSWLLPRYDWRFVLKPLKASHKTYNEERTHHNSCYHF